MTDRAGRAYMLAHVGPDGSAARIRLGARAPVLGTGNLDELGLGSPVLTYTLPSLARIELLAGRPAAAVSVSRQLCGRLERSRNFSWLASSASLLAEALVEVGELDEALHWTAIAEKHAAADDLDAHMLWCPVRAIVHARRGELAAAEPVAREAVTLAGRSDNLNGQAKARLTLAEVLRLQGRESKTRVLTGSRS